MTLIGTTERRCGMWEATVTAYQGESRLFAMAVTRADKYNAQVELETWAKENGYDVEWKN